MLVLFNLRAKITIRALALSINSDYNTTYRVFFNWDHPKSVSLLSKNIARGTTDPGYCVCNLNDLFQPKRNQITFIQKHDSSYRLNTLGPLCLWQCFYNFFFQFFLTIFSKLFLIVFSTFFSKTSNFFSLIFWQCFFHFFNFFLKLF